MATNLERELFLERASVVWGPELPEELRSYGKDARVALAKADPEFFRRYYLAHRPADPLALSLWALCFKERHSIPPIFGSMTCERAAAIVSEIESNERILRDFGPLLSRPYKSCLPKVIIMDDMDDGRVQS